MLRRLPTMALFLTPSAVSAVNMANGWWRLPFFEVKRSPSREHLILLLVGDHVARGVRG